MDHFSPDLSRSTGYPYAAMVGTIPTPVDSRSDDRLLSVRCHRFRKGTFLF